MIFFMMMMLIMMMMINDFFKHALIFSDDLSSDLYSESVHKLLTIF